MTKISVSTSIGLMLMGTMGLAGSPALADGPNKTSPFQITRGSFEAGPLIGLELVEVPRHKLLTMQQVSINATTLAEDVVDLTCWLEVERANPGDGRDPNLDFVVTPQRGLGVTAFDGHLAGGPITLYAEAGDRVIASCNALGAGKVVNSLSATLVGRLDPRKGRDD